MIGIYGAGSIGCYLGGMLVANGEDVVFLARPNTAADLAGGMDITSLDAPPIHVRNLEFASSASDLAKCSTILVCVKSMDTVAAGEALAGIVAPGTIVVSLQNGISNAGLLSAALPQAQVIDAMVAFNVARKGGNGFHRGTEGGIVLADKPGALDLSAIFNSAGIATEVSREISSVKWGKLLMNLNNAVNALSGLPLRAQLSMRKHRLLLADSVAEALQVLRKAGIRPARIGKVAPAIMPFLLRLPDPVFRMLAAGMLKIDDQARSSMADDLDRGRKPEIDYLQGEIVRLGKSVGVPTPVNSEIVERIRREFASKKGQER